MTPSLAINCETGTLKVRGQFEQDGPALRPPPRAAADRTRACSSSRMSPCPTDTIGVAHARCPRNRAATSSSSASICGNEVIGPWPISILPVKQVTRPSSPMRRNALKSEGNPPRPPRWRACFLRQRQIPQRDKDDNAAAKAPEKIAAVLGWKKSSSPSGR